ncbi:DUF1853 family protein [uncultured Algibacter sp.]|uniref:DUF1853 family protein n=1 Tax=uncultured Algibacter sp. TaxID=298659 RepID=UPI003216F20E
MIQKQYEGFINTPCLWVDKTVFGLHQFKIIPEIKKFNIPIDEKLRLGKYVERFVSFQLKQEKNITVLAENIQVQQDKTTLGELDCLLTKDTKPIHLEIIYKFYVYDASMGTDEIDCFIGPNRKDSLKEKLNKLKNKQLPILHTDACEKYLKKLHLNPTNILQQVYFKAQLFVPFSNQNIQLNILNINAIAGFYIKQDELKQLTDCKFYKPIKKDWLILPHKNVNWLNFKTFKVEAQDNVEQKFSVLYWVKFNTGELKKMFLVWW